MAIQTKGFPRQTPPHLRSLNTALSALFAEFFAYYEQGVLRVSADFAGVTDAAVQAVVTAAPDNSPVIDAKVAADAIPALDKSGFLTLLDLINLERQTSGRAVITPAQFVTAMKNKLDALP